MTRELLKALGALAFLCFFGFALWLDGWIAGTKEPRTPVAVVEESGHRRVRCE